MREDRNVVVLVEWGESFAQRPGAKPLVGVRKLIFLELGGLSPRLDPEGGAGFLSFQKRPGGESSDAETEGSAVSESADDEIDSLDGMGHDLPETGTLQKHSIFCFKILKIKFCFFLGLKSEKNNHTE